ncbi:MAG: carbohydrate-binding protein [bacterium]
MKKVIAMGLVIIFIIFIINTNTYADNFSYYPEINQPENLRIIDKGDMNDDQMLMILSLQGVLAQEKPRIYITAQKAYDYWLTKMEEDYGVSTEKYSDPLELVDLFKDELSGYILTETGSPEVNTATSLAGIKKALVVDVDLEEEVKELGLKKIMDSRDIEPGSIFADYKDEFNNSLIFPHDYDTLELRDYIIASRGMIFHESGSGTEKNFDEDEVYNWVESDAPQIGWGGIAKPDEGEFVGDATRKGIFTNPANNVLNLSTLAGIQKDSLEFKDRQTQIEKISIKPENDEKYLENNNNSRQKGKERIISGDESWEYKIDIRNNVTEYIEVEGEGYVEVGISGNRAVFIDLFSGEIDGSKRAPIPEAIKENFDQAYIKFSTKNDLDFSLKEASANYVSVEETEQEKELETPEEVHYLTMIMSDGDNFSFVLQGLADDSKYFASPYRGMFPMNWTIPVTAIDLAPAALDWYYEEAIQDNFVAGGSGAGYMYPSRNPDLEKHVERFNEYMGRAGLSYMGMLDWPEIGDEDFYEVASLYAEQPNIEGSFYFNYVDYAQGAGEIYFVDGTPFVAGRENLWEGDPSQLAQKISSHSTNPEEQEAYTIMNVHAWSHDMEDVSKLVDELDSHVEVVTIDEFFRQIKKNLDPEEYALTKRVEEKKNGIQATGKEFNIEAANYDVESGTEEEADAVAFINDGDYIGFEEVDFGENGFNQFTVQAASDTEGGTIELRLDGPEGQILGSIKVEGTSGWQNWEDFSTEIEDIKGKQDIYLKFTGQEGYLFNVDSLQFNNTH